MRRKKTPFKRQKTTAFTPSLEAITNISDDELSLSQGGGPITSTLNPSNTDAAKSKHCTVDKCSLHA